MTKDINENKSRGDSCQSKKSPNSGDNSHTRDVRRSDCDDPPDPIVPSLPTGGSSTLAENLSERGIDWRPHAGVVARYLYHGKIYYIAPERYQSANQAILVALRRIIIGSILESN